MIQRARAETVVRRATVLGATTPGAPGYPSRPADDAASRPTATFLPDHAIGVVGGAVAWVVPDAQVEPADVEGARVVEGRGCVALPGFVNCHTHAAMTMFRGVAEDVPTHSWFNEHIWPMEVNLTERDVFLGTQLAVGEMLLAGVTTFADHYFATDQVAAAVEAGGARALLASTFFSSQGQEGVERSAEFAERWNGAAGGRITTAMGPHAPYTVTDEHLAAAAGHAARLGVRTHLHAAESPAQTTSSLRRRGATPVQVLAETGVLDSGALIAHGAGIVEDDLRWLVPRADRVAVACCAKVYLKHAQGGGTPVRMLQDAGVTVGVGTDGPASHNTLDVLEALRFLSLVEKDRHDDATWLTSAHALDLLTRQSAAAVGLEGRVGVLAPGHRADVVLVDTTAPHLRPVHDLAAALVLSVRASDVVTVLVDGRVVVDDRRLTTMDLGECLAELDARLPGLTDRAHGRRVQDYAP